MSFLGNSKSCSRRFRRRANPAVALGTAIAAVLGVPAQAQDQDQKQVEEIVVTGSRIVRRDLESNSPIVTVDTEAFESQTGLNIESYVNQLPEFNPATTPVTAQADVQITPVNSVGISSISQRGFGPNRSLVLVDGKRPVPTNALMVTDINGIPSALIERVEIITGGASAVYGADAIGGVTNFIMRHDFEGFEIDMQYGASEAGDGDEARVYAVLGTNFADGRGNVTVGAEHYDRKAARERRRDFYTDAWEDPNAAGDFRLYGISSGFCFSACPNATTVNAVFANRPAGTNVFGPGPNSQRNFNFNADGSVWVNSGGGFYKYNGAVDGHEYALQSVYDGTRPNQGFTVNQLKYNFLDAYASGPQKRYSFFADGTFNLTDSVRFFGRARWAESKTRTLLFGTSAVYGWEAQVPYNRTVDSPVDPTLNYTNASVVAAVLANPAAYANPSYIPTGAAGAQHPVPLEWAILLNSNAAITSWVPQWTPNNSFPPRNTYNTNSSWQIETGVDIDLPIRDWTAEFYLSHGESSTYNLNTGNMSLSRWRALVQQPDYGRNAMISGNADSLRQYFGGGDVTCATGFYDTIFGGDQNLSQDCVDAVAAELQTRGTNLQNVIELNAQGGLFELPAGEVRGAAGFQYRRNIAKFQPDILQSQISFTDQVIGVYPTGKLDASVSVNDFYAELLIPVLSDLPFLRKLEVETGARYSDYNKTASTWTYKALANAEVNDWMRLRGGYNRATRAPNVGELFLNLQEVLIGGGAFGDPCGTRSQAPFGAGGALPDPVLSANETQTQVAPGQTLAGATSTLLICQAQMGAAASALFYAQNATGQTGGGFAWALQKGNPNLRSEKADTFTAGLVLRSPFESPWLAGLSASLDWWRVDIKDAIQQYSVDYARYLCYGTASVTDATAAAAQAATPACQQVPRNTSDGMSTTITLAYDNLATIETSGIDLTLNWRARFEDLGFNLPGGVGMNMQASWLDYYETKTSPLPIDVVTDWAGSLGPTLSGTNGGAYRYRMFTNFSYFWEGLSVSLRWRHLPSVWGVGMATERAIIRNNEQVAAGAPGNILGYTPSTAFKIKSYDMFDLSFNWSINDTISVRGGINNIMNRHPNVTSASAGYPFGTTRADVCDAAAEALGCRDPSGYSQPSNGSGVTSAGYYDTLGRRFFFGVKARF
ncbi:MAG: TonB-dependent receptor [Gammaproteobacteria bacterium]|nr:TonB-dependent receptor [Gammaproteobacteria bacterium]